MLTHYSDFAVDNIVQQQCYARIRAGMWGSLGGGGYLTPVGVVKEKTFIYPLFASLSLKDNTCCFPAVKRF